MKRFFLPLLAAGLALGLFAGTGTQVGTWTEKSAPEFITINLWIKSQCYDSPITARSDNDPVTKQVQELLSQFITKGSTVDKIYFDGGIASEYFHKVYKNGEEKILCPNTFQKLSKVTLVTENLKDFSANWDIIQTEALKKFKVLNSSTLSESALTFVTIENPIADVCEKKRSHMQELALTKATQNAFNKFWACASVCGIPKNKITITGISAPTSGDNYGVLHGIKDRAYGAPPSDGGPIITFHDVSETVSVEIKYSFPDADFENCVCSH